MSITDHARQYIAWDPNPTTRDAMQALLDAHDEAALSKLVTTRMAFGTAGLDCWTLLNEGWGDDITCNSCVPVGLVDVTVGVFCLLCRLFSLGLSQGFARAWAPGIAA